MFEATTNTAARNAITKAHAERGQAIADVWTWLFGAAKR